MLREHSKFFNRLWRVVDLIWLSLCFILAYAVRFSLFPVAAEVETIPSLGRYAPNLALILGLWLVTAEFLGLYKSKRIQSPWADWRIIFTSLVVMVFLYASVGFIFKSFDVSRLLLAIYAPLALVVLGLWHFLFRIVLTRARIKGYNRRNLLIIGAGATGRRFAFEISTHRGTGYNVVGFLDNHIENVDTPYPILGKVNDIRRILSTRHIDRVVVALGTADSDQLDDVVREGEYAGVEVNIIPDLFQYIHPKAKVLNLNGIPLIGVRPNPIDTWQYVYIKRAFDLLFSLGTLIFISPLILVVMFLVRLTSKGPIFFAQQRLGTHGKPFKFYKFRTMYHWAEEEGDTHWTTNHDERITWIGRFLRRTSLDELPQFWNVFKGDMSVVGPRPERPYFAHQFRDVFPGYMIRHQVKTGVTGWAQVHGLRGDTSIEDRLRFDLYYIENWSFPLDMKIIVMTLLRGFTDKNAY